MALEGLSFILDIPAYVENFTKTCRAIHDYNNLDESHKALMTRAIMNSERFDYTMSFARDPTIYTMETQRYIAGLVSQSKRTLDETLKIVHDWQEKLGIKTDKDSESEPRVTTKKIIPSLSSCLKWKGSVKVDNPTPSYLRGRIAEASYMILGQREIISSMESLEHWLDDLRDAILTTTLLPGKLDETSRGAYQAESLAFVNRAKNRVNSGVAINQINYKELESFSDIDVTMGTGIYGINSGKYARCIIDPRNVRRYTGRNKGEIAWKETENIARLFAEEGDSALCSSVGILPSCGYSELDTHLHGIVFRLPLGIAPPRSLRSLLVDGVVKHSLHDRILLSIRLSTSVLVVHSLGLVHKNIKPDSILMTEHIEKGPRELYPYKIGLPYLLAFDSSRTTTGPTMKGDYDAPSGELWGALYTHPRHFGYRNYAYEMRDDIYSLGICLLEIALWKSLFIWEPGLKGFVNNNTILDLSDTQMKKVLQEEGRAADTSLDFMRKKCLVNAAKERIPSLMGELFANVVDDCLRFGDAVEESEDRRNSSSDVAPDEQSTCFVKNILAKLRSIKM